MSLPNTFTQSFQQIINVQQQRGAQAALPLARELVRSFADNDDAQNLLANILIACVRSSEAIDLLKQNPRLAQNVMLLNTLSSAHIQLQQNDMAASYLAQALAINPNHIHSLFNMGRVQNALSRPQQARVYYEKVLSLNPKHEIAAYNLAGVHQTLGDFQTALHYFRLASDLNPAYANALASSLFIQHYCLPYDAEKVAQESFVRARRFAQMQAPIAPIMPSENAKRLHIGLVSADLHLAHPVGFFIQGLLNSREANRFDWSVYCNSPNIAAINQLAPQRFQHQHAIHAWSDARVIEQIRTDGIDILIDLSGFVANHRAGIFAVQAAPVQVAWLGYFATTGLPAMNAVIADAVCVPSEEQHLFSERVYQMPHTRLCMMPPENAPAVAPLPALKNGFITFGCYQNPYKINDEVLKTWAKIAQALPDARWHFQNSLQAADSPERGKFHQKLLNLGFAENRISLSAGTSRADYLASYAQIDLVLDTFPYTGGTTTAEALYMGVPTITLTGKGMMARQGEQLLRAADLPEFVAQHLDEYIEKALFWSAPTNREALAQLRCHLRQQVSQSALFDHATFARDWCALIETIWQDAGGKVLAQSEADWMPSEKPSLSTVIQTLETQGAAQALPLALQLLQGVPDANQKNIAAIVLAKNGQREQAITLWRSLHNADALANAAQAYLALNRPADAAQCLDEALAFAPTRANLLQQAAQVEKQLKHFQTAIDLLLRIPENERNINVLEMLGNAYAHLNHFAEAEKYLKQVLQIAPQHENAINDLGYIYTHNYDFAKLKQLIELEYEILEHNPAHYAALTNAMFARYFVQPYDIEAISNKAKALGAAFAQTVSLPPLAMPSEKNPHKKLHIGLVSADLRNHPVGYFIESLLTSAAAREFEWTAYAQFPAHQPADNTTLTARIKPYFTNWRQVQGISDEALAAQIHADGIDILIDLGGYTVGNRLHIFAQRTAPVQISWLGYFATTGLPHMDAVIADEICVPAGEERFFSERVYKMPHTRLCLMPPENAPAVAPLPALKNGFITFGCFQNIMKINDKVLQTWAAIAQRLPDAKWRFHNKAFAPDSCDLPILRQKLCDLGFSDGNLQFHAATSRADYFAAHGEVDLILDTFPYTGGTTTAEALYMGVPTLTFTQAGMLARQGEQMMRAAGLDEWVARSIDEYIEQAVQWGSPANRTKLAQMRAKMRENILKTPLFNQEQFGKDWCALVKKIWHDYCGVMPSENVMPSEKTPSPVKVPPAWVEPFQQILQTVHQQSPEEALEKALALHQQFPDVVPVLNLTATILSNNQRYAEAIELWQQIPDFENDPNVLPNLGKICLLENRLREAQEYLQKTFQLNPYDPTTISNLAFGAHYLTPYQPEKIAQDIQKHIAIFTPRAQLSHLPPPRRLMPSESEKRLHIGLLTGDLKQHPVGYFIEGLLQSQAAKQFIWSAYNTSLGQGEMTARLQSYFDYWHHIEHQSVRESVEKIRADGIDILIDLSGFTAHHRFEILINQAAPVQVEWLGWFATTGIKQIQAVIADPYCVPPEEEHLFSERVYRMPHTRLCMSEPRFDIAPNQLPALKNGFITFGCFQNLNKVNDEVLQTWAKIAQRLPDAKWRFQSKHLKTPAQRAEFHQKLLDYGFSDGNISLHAHSSLNQYFAAHHEVDLILDTFPYTGGTTTAEALWMGVPTLTFTQPSMLSRQGEQMLKAADLPAWVATSLDEYLEKALFWNAPENWAKLAQMRAGLREKVLNSPLFDNEQFSQDWSALIRQIWRDACGAMPSESSEPSVMPSANNVQTLAVTPQLMQHILQQAQQKETHDLNAAIKDYLVLAQIDENNVSVAYRIGYLYSKLGNIAQAVKWFERVLKIEPSHFPALAKTRFNRCYLPDFDAEKEAQNIIADMQTFAQAYLAQHTIAPAKMPSEKKSHHKLHIGLVSADLHAHPVGYFLQSLLTSQAAREFDWTCYHQSDDCDDLTRRLQGVCRHWHQIATLSDEEVVAQIRADGIDILLDLSGYTGNSRLPIFLHQAAPVQVEWLGWFASTGVPTMQAVIADKYCVPREEKQLFNERVYRMPHTRLCMSVPQNLPAINELPALKNGFITFGCFQNLNKINDKVLQTWAAIAQHMPDAHWRFQSENLGNHQPREQVLRQKLLNLGFSDGKVHFHPFSHRADYFAAHHQVDLILDTFPYTGGTTTAEALLMGVPTITLTGKGMLARQGEQIMSAAGLSEWVAQHIGQYLEKTLFWSAPSNREKLAILRAHLREKVLISPLFDSQTFAQDWCALIKQIWHDACYVNND